MREDCLYKPYCDGDCSKLCVQYSQMSYMLEHSNLPKSQQRIHKLVAPKCDLDAFERLHDIQMNIKQFVKQGKNLYIWSRETGNGKTTWSIKILMQYFDSVWEYCQYNVKGVFVNVPTFLYKLKQTISTPDAQFAELQRNIGDVDLVVFDDITATQLSRYDYSSLLAPIDMRLFEGKSSIFTGNYSPDELENILGKRLKSRICDGIIIELKGNDMRESGDN